MFFSKTVFVLSVVLVPKVYGKITDEEYLSMPPVFHLDDFDRCLLLPKTALYCFVTVQLAPIESRNHSDVWRIITEVAGNPKNYKHDQLRHGICVSESCPEVSTNLSVYKHDHELLKSEISKRYSEKYKHLKIKGFVTEMHCETDQPFYSIDIYDILVGLFLVALCICVIFASFYEGCARYKTKEEYDKITTTKFGKIISCFSIPKNWKRLASTYISPEANKLKCITGIRFSNIFVILITHTCMITFARPVLNTQFPEKMTEEPFYVLLSNMSFAMQTFFLMAGMLLSYHFFLVFENQKDVKFSYIVLAFINRYIRLTPTLMVMVAVNGTWLYHLSRGPLWDKLVGEEYRNCRENWWTNLLYINNYYNSENMCIQQTWYLAADTQLYLLSLIILTFIWKYQKYTKTILGICLTIGILIPGIINYVNDYDIVVRYYIEPLYNIMITTRHWHVMYASGYTNIGGYMLGLILGYVFYKYREQKLFTRKLYITIWWILICGLPLTMIYVGLPFYQDDYEPPRFGAAVYMSLARNLFALGIAIAIFGYAQGLGWFLRDCVTWSPLQVLGKLTYCVYLVHLAYMRVQGGIIRLPIFISKYFLFSETFGNLVVAYIFATILCLFVEMPSSALQKLLIPQLAEKRKNDPVKTTKRVDNEKFIDHKDSKV